MNRRKFLQFMSLIAAMPVFADGVIKSLLPEDTLPEGEYTAAIEKICFGHDPALPNQAWCVIYRADTGDIIKAEKVDWREVLE